MRRHLKSIDFITDSLIEFIDESVSTIKYQTYKNWELIIGINGHPENSEVYQKAKEYENDKIKVYDI